MTALLRAPLLALLATACALATAGCRETTAEGAVAPGGPGAVATQVRVRTASVERAQLEAPERVSGTVRAFHEAKVTAETNGRVVRRAVERGRDVAPGDLLVELDRSRLELELRQAEANLRARRTDLGHAQREHERAEKLAAQSAVSEQRLDDLRHALDSARNAYELAIVARDTARRLLADTEIRAPIAGRVDDLLVDVGDFLAPGEPVAHVLDFRRARVFGGVTAAEAARLAEGMAATASFPSLGGLVQDAVLRSVARAADREDGTYRIELWIDEPDPRLRDGMVASLVLDPGSGEAHPLAPRAALMRRSGRSEVFVVERDGEGGAGVARRRAVRTGRSGGDRVEILDGLAAGDEVVIDGQFALRDGARVAIDGAPAPSN